MEAYGHLSLENHHEALDFTAAAMKSTVRNQESPVLDLSCKKPEAPPRRESSPSSCVLSPISSNSPTMENRNQQNCHQSHENSVHFGEDERKSPFEARTFMVTPPSETDSPRKPKFEPVFNTQMNGNVSPISSADSIANRYPLLPMNHLPLPVVVPTVLPNLLANQNGGQTIASIVQLPVSSSANSSPIPHEVASPMTSPEMGKKAPRPFKAYPKDPLSLTMGTAEMMYDPNSNEAYSEFRKRMLESVRRTNEGTNIKMRRVTKSPGLPTSTMDDKDAAYWERRRKNNEAAKRSRDARRAKEDEIAIRAAFLEQENMKLKYELVALRNETAKLRCMVYTN